ncbi:unnamed protein product [Ceutorhynchus assimilis]|uniref:Uncharacterized protein n=1 Tax=Ceutorhynchus assimilis TaxID=467358 RepID=A0A9N9MGR5_9CUCU|nr:unnamed protein product [Ceutorhynchus assimilis]
MMEDSNLHSDNEKIDDQSVIHHDEAQSQSPSSLSTVISPITTSSVKRKRFQIESFADKITESENKIRPSYTLPSSKRVSTTLLDTEYNAMKTEIKGELDNSKNLHLQCDG